MKAATHHGEDYNENLDAYRNTNFDALETLFDITQKLILDQKREILNVSTLEWHFTPWMRSILRHDKALQWARAKVHVYSDSVLCLGRMHGHHMKTEHLTVRTTHAHFSRVSAHVTVAQDFSPTRVTLAQVHDEFVCWSPHFSKVILSSHVSSQPPWSS